MAADVDGCQRVVGDQQVRAVVEGPRNVQARLLAERERGAALPDLLARRSPGLFQGPTHLLWLIV